MVSVMTDKKSRPRGTGGLSKKATGKAAPGDAEALEKLTPKAVAQLLHELRIHQVELEAQNEELLRAQEALAASKERYANLFEFAPVGYVTLSEKSVVLEANLAAGTLLGVPKDSLLNKPFARLVNPLPEDQDVFFVHRRKLFETGLSQTCELRLSKSARAPFWARLELAAANDAKGAPQCRLVMSDITDSKMAAEARAAREWQATFDAIADVVCVLSRDFEFLAVNKAGMQAIGLPRERILGRKCCELIHKAAVPIPICPCLKMMESGRPEVSQYEQNGRVYSLLAWPIVDAGGNIGSFAHIVKDVTEQRKTEEVLHTVQRLESLGVLAGGIAHDFNNLMAGIFGNIDLALDECKDTKVSKYLATAMSTIGRATGLTQQLLTFARGGAPAVKAGPLFPFVQETAQFALSGSPVSCRFEIPENLWHCSYDKNQLSQVIDNVIINAHQAMPLGGSIALQANNMTLDADEHPVLAKGEYVKISIRDTGIGIPKEILPRIFDPFFTTKTKGHGLGLATCYSIIRRHGGAIDVESEPGKGSTFHIYLPAAHDSVLSLKQEVAVLHKGSGRVLVMDDEAVIRATVGDMLVSCGYSAVFCDNGKDAAALFVAEINARRPMAAVLLDLTIPGGMGGREAVAEIRKIDAEIPVFVVSGYAEDPVMANPADYGFTASICKPFRKSDLSGMLNKYMKKPSRT